MLCRCAVVSAAGQVGEVCGLGERGLSGALPPFVHAEVLRIRFLRVSLIREMFEGFEMSSKATRKRARARKYSTGASKYVRFGLALA